MFDPGIIPVVGELADLDLATADRRTLDQAVALSARIRAWLDAGDVAVARRVRQLSSAEPTGCSPTIDAADVLSHRGRRDDRDARAATARSTLCDQMPGFETALVEGSVSTGHLDVVVAATRRLTPAERSAVVARADELVAVAVGSSVVDYRAKVRAIVAESTTPADDVDRLERQRRRCKLTRWEDRDTGMWKTLIEVDPETGARIWTALDAKIAVLRQRAETASAPLDRIAVEALAELILAPGGGDPDLRRVPEICVNVDLRTVTEGAHAAGLCELSDGTAVPVATAVRWCCEADIVPILIDADGQAVDTGRARRTANRKQRRLLRATYRTCAHPNCAVPFDRCQIHHVVPWERLGSSDLANLLPLCTGHHHLVHEGGWSLTMTPDRVITLTRPDGDTEFVGRTCDRPTGVAPAGPIDTAGVPDPPTGAAAAGSIDTAGAPDRPGPLEHPNRAGRHRPSRVLSSHPGG